jgi:hypothetical protein
LDPGLTPPPSLIPRSSVPTPADILGALLNEVETFIGNVESIADYLSYVKNLIQDALDHPENWETKRSITERSTKRGNKGGTSTEEELVNKDGDVIYRHTLRDADGKIIDKHYRPYPKQLSREES